ncbi:uncharacterized protein TNCV_3728921 [Trichonephila clavipes]|nr:uncharacterized protein TNCV_3728921 [Trichonephila clavipes]
MEHFLEQRYAIKFCIKLGKTGKDTNDMIEEAYGDAVMGRSGVFEWHMLFREDRERVEYDRSGPARPTRMCHKGKTYSTVIIG